jgi:peptide/nickel transport system substrate-binding protein
LSWTFNLRHGVEFSNGQEMTSADVKFSVLRVGAKADNPWTFINADIAKITTPSKFQVTITTKTPWAPLQADMALFANGVIPNNYAGEKPSVFWQHPIGTGPFMVKQWIKGNELELVKNPHYWQKGKPYLDGVNFVPTTTPACCNLSPAPRKLTSSRPGPRSVSSRPSPASP